MSRLPLLAAVLPLSLLVGALGPLSTGCAASAADDSDGTSEAAIGSGLAQKRPTAIEVTTDKHNKLSASILVDPPTGAGWASPSILVSYEDSAHAWGSAQQVIAHVTVHFSAPDRHEHSTLWLRSDSSGFMAPMFIDLADVQHVEGVDIAVGDDHRWDATDEHHERAYHLGGIRADAEDAASVGPYDRIAVRGVSRHAHLGPTLDLSVDVDEATFLREEAPGYDGKGQAFALVPSTKSGHTQWDRIVLAGQGHFSGSVASPDQATVTAKGIAFGVTTNMGTLWLQGPNDNLKP